MPDPFDLTAWISALAARWKTVAAISIGAAVIAFGASMLLPPVYEATVLMTIQPGIAGASNPAAMSVPYLDSLRGYEQWMQGEAMIARLIETAKLSDYTVERFRRSALRATVAKGTRTLQVAVRMNDPQRAHDTAVKLAQMAVESNNGVGRA